MQWTDRTKTTQYMHLHLMFWTKVTNWYFRVAQYFKSLLLFPDSRICWLPWQAAAVVPVQKRLHRAPALRSHAGNQLPRQHWTNVVLHWSRPQQRWDLGTVCFCVLVLVWVLGGGGGYTYALFIHSDFSETYFSFEFTSVKKTHSVLIKTHFE